MALTSQLNLPPMLAIPSGNAEPSAAKNVALVDLAVRAFVRCGFNAQQAAGMLGMSASDFSKAFSVNWPERNPVMKKWDALDYTVRREFAALLAADYGLDAQDSEPVRVLRDLSRVLAKVG